MSFLRVVSLIGGKMGGKKERTVEGGVHVDHKRHGGVGTQHSTLVTDEAVVRP